jgi:hypothetical protein
MIYLQLIRSFRCLFLAGEGRIHRIISPLKEAFDHCAGMVHRHAEMLEAYPAAL